IIRDGKTGIIIPPGDSEARAGAILKLLNDKALCRRMGEAGRRLIQSEFSLESLGLKLEREIYSLIF
ncbi:MAG: glycosyltransferase, partial [Fidelibacterota bacterium]